MINAELELELELESGLGLELELKLELELGYRLNFFFKVTVKNEFNFHTTPSHLKLLSQLILNGNMHGSDPLFF